MRKEELWEIYTKKNPQFAQPDSRFTMTGNGLKKLFDQTWDMAHELGVKNGKALAETDKRPFDINDILGMAGKK